MKNMTTVISMYHLMLLITLLVWEEEANIEVLRQEEITFFFLLRTTFPLEGTYVEQSQIISTSNTLLFSLTTSYLIILVVPHLS